MRSSPMPLIAALKFGPEICEQRLPLQLAVRDLVELIFETGGEVVLDVVAEEVRQERGDEAGRLSSGNEARLVHADVLTVAQHLQESRRRSRGGRCRVLRAS